MPKFLGALSSSPVLTLYTTPDDDQLLSIIYVFLIDFRITGDIHSSQILIVFYPSRANAPLVKASFSAVVHPIRVNSAIKAMSVGRVFLDLVLLLPIVIPCTKFSFHKFDDAIYDGTVMMAYRRELLRPYDCQRACLLIKGCRGFNMQWIQDIADVGYCDLVDMRLAQALSSKSNHSVYGKYS